MCGIAGLFDPRWSRSRIDYQSVLRTMTDALAHRGPDDQGAWVEPASGLAFGHRRLSIIDLSPNGHQPMWSASGRFIIVFNGEVYNFLDLAADLAANGCVFRGRSDTEVLLAAVEMWGLDSALRRVIGMFAFALWDAKERMLHLARDRVGEKPLYYGWVADRFLFASELKALRAVPGWHGTVSREALDLLMRYGYIPAPFSIYEGIYKLTPGCTLSLPTGSITLSTPFEPDPDRAPADGVAPRRYWSALQVARQGLARPVTSTDVETVSELDSLLRSVVRQQMIADVPLGAFLSGGIDSTLVVACMQAQSRQPVKTFTIGYREQAFNEAEYARAIARHLGTDHQELYVTPEQALDVIPRLPVLYDEPFADSSQIPMLLVCQLARRHVKVSLSGDGGDELFAGYNRYLWPPAISRRIRWLPTGIRASLASAITHFSPTGWNQSVASATRHLPSLRRRVPPEIGSKLHKLAAALSAPSPMGIYTSLIGYWDGPSVVLGHTYGHSAPRAALGVETDFVDEVMCLDLMRYLPDDNLVKVDRASMSVGLEARVPLLDPRIVEYAWRVPRSMKIRHGKGKWILREVLARYVPRKLTERPKMGFSVPIGQWLTGPLRYWAEELLDESTLRSDGFFDVQRVRRRWQEHKRGRRNWGLSLWTVLMFQAWFREQRGAQSESGGCGVVAAQSGTH
jgi:asparagine synthase (glutamine-hydrolysing)